VFAPDLPGANYRSILSRKAYHFLGAQGFLAAHGFAAHGFLAAPGFAALAAQGLLAAQGFAERVVRLRAEFALPELVGSARRYLTPAAKN